jgi:hypothetical protein
MMESKDKEDLETIFAASICLEEKMNVQVGIFGLGDYPAEDPIYVVNERWLLQAIHLMKSWTYRVCLSRSHHVRKIGKSDIRAIGRDSQVSLTGWDWCEPNTAL